MTQSPRELAQQKIQMRKQQQKLLVDLLTVMDALDRASAHWHQAQHSPNSSVSSNASPALPWWQRWRQWLRLDPPAEGSPEASTGSVADVVDSARDGMDMIRESMLSVLSQHQVEPISTHGEPFDPNTMHALGQRTESQVPPQTVVEEVVRGYRWQDRVLREAQVIVAVPPAEKPSPER
ncbi:nucleotide exchange factor GrpE [Lyngbya confervoides]|uniref:Protein GrpE n=1 Tax=Lyngbya confervoides BDU141951 TaxID=1574623 RepID=A0ABD4T636_9CYAN|nr:nucleotide exchange factor GrpE [Lyngbya confervoides]MCM1984020.1 nucleotide exchange factor GrpE [Lyngbya confervoides BDU141951]